MSLKPLPTDYKIRLFSPLPSWSSHVSSSTRYVKEYQTWTAMYLDPFYHFHCIPVFRHTALIDHSCRDGPQRPMQVDHALRSYHFKWINARHPITLRSSATTNSSESVKFYYAQIHGPSITNACGQEDVHYQCKIRMINTNKFRILKATYQSQGRIRFEGFVSMVTLSNPIP
jgi:hypothetical protein